LERQRSLIEKYQPRYTSVSYNGSKVVFTDNQEKKSRAFRFKEYFINEIERVLTERPEVIPNSDVPRIKIVDAVFAFKNQHLMTLLKQRGSYLIRSQMDKLDQIDKTITQYLKDNEEEITTPARAYITF
jgi:hypothetical protein